MSTQLNLHPLLFGTGYEETFYEQTHTHTGIYLDLQQPSQTQLHTAALLEKCQLAGRIHRYKCINYY